MKLITIKLKNKNNKAPLEPKTIIKIEQHIKTPIEFLENFNDKIEVIPNKYPKFKYEFLRDLNLNLELLKSIK
ncbi:hypothetical protein GCM10011368_18550 [Hyunsoonleella pacifica]|nr:hypothetical protein GCM10011368_18550 [Hyunsoonleella pacifica]